MDPNKDVVLDVSSTSSDSEDDFVSPLTQLTDKSATTAGAKYFLNASTRQRVYKCFRFVAQSVFLLSELKAIDGFREI